MFSFKLPKNSAIVKIDKEIDEAYYIDKDGKLLYNERLFGSYNVCTYGQIVEHNFDTTVGYDTDSGDMLCFNPAVLLDLTEKKDVEVFSKTRNIMNTNTGFRELLFSNRMGETIEIYQKVININNDNDKRNFYVDFKIYFKTPRENYHKNLENRYNETLGDNYSVINNYYFLQEYIPVDLETGNDPRKITENIINKTAVLISTFCNNRFTFTELENNTIICNRVFQYKGNKCVIVNYDEMFCFYNKETCNIQPIDENRCIGVPYPFEYAGLRVNLIDGNYMQLNDFSEDVFYIPFTKDNSIPEKKYWYVSGVKIFFYINNVGLLAYFDKKQIGFTYKYNNVVDIAKNMTDSEIEKTLKKIEEQMEEGDKNLKEMLLKKYNILKYYYDTKQRK